MICCYRAISSGKSKWSTRTVSTIGRSRNKPAEEWSRSHFEESKAKQSKSLCQQAKARQGWSRAQQLGCVAVELSHACEQGWHTDAENAVPPAMSPASTVLFLAKELLLPEQAITSYSLIGDSCRKSLSHRILTRNRCDFITSPSADSLSGVYFPGSLLSQCYFRRELCYSASCWAWKDFLVIVVILKKGKYS